jgi:hypothetical protein
MKLDDPEFWASVTCLLARPKRTPSMPPHLFADIRDVTISPPPGPSRARPQKWRVLR